MKSHSSSLVFQCATGLAILAALYALIAGTYGITRYLTLLELHLASEIETDTKTIDAITQMIIAALCAAASFGVRLLFRIPERRKEVV